MSFAIVAPHFQFKVAFGSGKVFGETSILIPGFNPDVVSEVHS